MRGDAIEVAVRNGHEFLPRKALRERHHALLGRMERQVVGPESVSLRLALRVETIDARRNSPRDDPFPFGDLAIFHADADRGHRGFGAFVQYAEEGRLSADPDRSSGGPLCRWR